MSSRPTGTSSFTQKYCCLRREPQVLCSKLNEMARLASVAEKSFTGMDTNPKDTVNDAIERAAICLTPCFRYAGERIVIQRDFSGLCTLQRLLQALLAVKCLLPALAGLGEACGRVGDAKVERMGARQLLPSKRHRHRSARRAARRISDIQRLAAHVHVVVHEDLPGALRHAPFERDVLRMQAHEMAADEFRHLPRSVEVDGAA